jgi:hypothetical protein
MNYKGFKSQTEDKSANALPLFGILNGRIKVYLNKYAPGNTMLVAYNGVNRENATDGGFTYCLDSILLEGEYTVDPTAFEPYKKFVCTEAFAENNSEVCKAEDYYELVEFEFLEGCLA